MISVVNMCADMYGRAWACVGVRRHALACMGMHGVHKCVWATKIMQGHARVCADVPGPVWACMAYISVCGQPRSYRDMPGRARACVGLHEA